jgi:hypothetical protein
VNIGAQDPAASTLPDADSVRALFVAFRHLLAQQSDTHFAKVCKALHRMQLTDEEREVLKKCRALWKDVLRTDPLKLVVNGDDISPERMIDLYFNGRDFHRDRDKRLLRESIESGLGQAFALARVPQSISDLMQAASYAEQIVKNVLERESLAQVESR